MLWGEGKGRRGREGERERERERGGGGGMKGGRERVCYTLRQRFVYSLCAEKA